MIYLKVGQGWQKFQFILDPGAGTIDELGEALQIDSSTKRFVIGVQDASPGGKVVFGKIN